MSTSTTPTPDPDPADFLQSIRSRIRSAQFEDGLLDDAKKLVAMQARLSEIDELLYFKSINSAFEVFDYFGLYGTASNVVDTEGRRAALESSSWLRIGEPRAQALLKERTGVLLHYGLSHYRTGSYLRAQRVFDQARRVVEDVLRSPEDPCHSTLSALEYFCGQAYRQQDLFEEASASFNASVEHAVRRLTWCKQTLGSHDANDSRLVQEARRANRRCALALALGLGWIAARQGHLSRALPLFWTARRLLFSTEDWVSKAYVELLFGSVQRALAGPDEKKLEEARQTLQLAYDEFGQGKGRASDGHRPYRIHAAYQKALVALYSKDYREAMDLIGEMRDVATILDNSRWICISRIVESRVHRAVGHSGLAFAAARQAVEDAAELPDRSCKVDALIARGECNPDANLARSDFALAITLVDNNPQTQGVCHIHLTQAYLKLQNVFEAEKHFAAWEALSKSTENRVVHELARKAEEALKGQRRDFVISGDAKDLLLVPHEKRLWDFLLAAASRGKTTDTEVAARLGISRAKLIRLRGPQDPEKAAANGAKKAKAAPARKSKGARAGASD